MGFLVVVLTAIAVCCSETRCDTPSTTTIVAPEDRGVLMKTNRSHVIGDPPGGFLWRNLGKLAKIAESKGVNGTSDEAKNRTARLLGSLAFLAGLSFGGLASAASSTVKTIAKMPQASFALNLGPSKDSPYFAAYYSPYSILPYPFFYHGPLGLVPGVNSARPQAASHDDLTPQVISVVENGQPDVFAENNEEYDEEKSSDNDRNTDGADHRPELRAEADRNAEEKMTIRNCKEGHKKHSNSFKELSKGHEDLQVDADDSVATLRATNMTTEANQTVTRDRTTLRPLINHQPGPTDQNHRPDQHFLNQHPVQQYPNPLYPNQPPNPLYPNQPPNPLYPYQPPNPLYPHQLPNPLYPHQYPSQQYPNPTPNPQYPHQLPNQQYPDQQHPNISHTTSHPYFPGYYDGYPQDISHVDFTTGTNHYQDHGQTNYNLPYEQPTNFYRADLYSSEPANPYFPGSLPSDQINSYVGTDFGRVYPSEYQPPHGNGFKPVK